MPKDKRLYMTFPNDFPEHPKIKPLSDAAFRVFVEINGYSRTQDLDGRVPVRVAKAKWRPKALAELQANHPERPTLTIDGDDFVIHNYGEHQQTKADREMESARNSVNGKKGGRPPKVKPEETGSVSVGQAKKSQSQSQESEIDVTHLTESGQVGIARAGDSDPTKLDVERARAAGISDLPALRSMFEKTAEHPVSLRGAVILATAICSKSKLPVDDVDAYCAVVCRNSAAEVQQAYFDLDVEAVA